ncbi:MAG: hypothetical protein EHM24_06680 [Acidobacteria bacterium]|nr:MAG: hypothetical protein EHM24_06680 [Acidobacteriota bacterium]
MSLRTILAPVAGAVMYLLVGPWPMAAGGTPVIEQLGARAVAVSGTEDAGRVGIYIERWSTDEELESVGVPLMRGDVEKALEAMRQRRGRVGVVLMPGVQGRGARTRTRTPKNLLFAREFSTPEGRRVVVASDERLGLGESQLDARKEVYEFNVVEIRFGPDGTGIGKVATAPDVVYDPATRSLQVKEYAAKPARLVAVKPDTF